MTGAQGNKAGRSGQNIDKKEMGRINVRRKFKVGSSYFITSRRGTHQLVVGDYLYSKNRNIGEKTYWICSEVHNGCRSRCVSLRNQCFPNFHQSLLLGGNGLTKEPLQALHEKRVLTPNLPSSKAGVVHPNWLTTITFIINKMVATAEYFGDVQNALSDVVVLSSLRVKEVLISWLSMIAFIPKIMQQVAGHSGGVQSTLKLVADHGRPIFIDSGRAGGTYQLVINKFIYNKERSRGKKIFWRCSDRAKTGCPSRCITSTNEVVITCAEHNHNEHSSAFFIEAKKPGGYWLAFNDFIYRQDRVRGDRTFWRCVDSPATGCRARCVTFQNQVYSMCLSHTHEHHRPAWGQGRQLSRAENSKEQQK
ncbi:unnamed protein product [Timema podura]|uniref:FLYWCH-type domain-containing protein n=1 Tax=Timema podura TaxID=61482 RepID=A0ABN7NDL7_TIMPD|nr:unnamed protein product [Timema podura]